MLPSCPDIFSICRLCTSKIMRLTGFGVRLYHPGGATFISAGLDRGAGASGQVGRQEWGENTDFGTFIVSF